MNSKPLLNDITIEITNHCQLHCRHCGIWAEKERHEMTASMVMKTLQELLGRYRLNFVSITGGEPFLNRNCGRLLKALSLLRQGGAISGFGVYSNAAYGEGVRRAMTNYAPFLQGMHMGISIDGTEAVHDRLRGAGAYKKTLSTIEWLSRNFGRDIVLEFKFTINSLNYAQFEDVYRLARQFKARFSPKIMESGVGDYYHRHEMPEVDALSSLQPEMIASVKTQVERIFNDNYAGLDRALVEATLVLLSGGRGCIGGCATPSKSLFINSRRHVYPCLYMEPAGKISENGCLPPGLDALRQAHTRKAMAGRCPGCFAYHGFLKKFNLAYLQAPSVPQHQRR